MAQVTVTLPADVQRHLEMRAEDGGFSGSGAYLHALAQRDLDDYRADVVRVQALIDEGIASGIVDEEPEEVLRKTIAGFPSIKRD